MNRTAYSTPRCPGTLKKGFETYCPATLRNLFGGRQVFHVLPDFYREETWEPAIIPGPHHGGQSWYGINQLKNRLHTDIGGRLMLKTVFPGTGNLRFSIEQPANEHLCLQLASQVFDIDTIPNALVFFPDGQPALITGTFTPNLQFQDFNSLQHKLVPGKPLITYRRMAEIIDALCAAALIAKERLFRQVVFSWLMTNGWGHGKFYGLVKTSRGDYTMAPLYFACCQRLHELSSELALPGGLYEGDTATPAFRENGSYTRNEFTSYGNRIGLPGHIVENILNMFVNGKEKAEKLIGLAFLPDEAKAIIQFSFNEKWSRLR